MIDFTNNFYDAEIELFLKLNSIPCVKRPIPVIAFLVLSEWCGTSLRSGVWTFYETAKSDDIIKTAEYLNNKGYDKIAEYLLMGINDYKNPEYAKDYNYQSDWLEKAEKTDRWILKNEEYLNNCKRFISDICAETMDFLTKYDYAVSEYRNICSVDTYVLNDNSYHQLFDSMGIPKETAQMLTAPYEKYKEKIFVLLLFTSRKILKNTDGFQFYVIKMEMSFIISIFMMAGYAENVCAIMVLSLCLWWKQIHHITEKLKIVTLQFLGFLEN